MLETHGPRWWIKVPSIKCYTERVNTNVTNHTSTNTIRFYPESTNITPSGEGPMPPTRICADPKKCWYSIQKRESMKLSVSCSEATVSSGMKNVKKKDSLFPTI